MKYCSGSNSRQQKCSMARTCFFFFSLRELKNSVVKFKFFNPQKITDPSRPADAPDGTTPDTQQPYQQQDSRSTQGNLQDMYGQPRCQTQMV